MPKLSDLEQDDRRSIEEELTAKSSSMGFDSWDTLDDNSDKNFLKEAVGMCHNCKQLHYCRSEFAGHDKVFARCSLFEMMLSGQNRVTECNCYSPRKILTLEEMYAMATLIDPDKEGVKGFISTDPKLMTKKGKNDAKIQSDRPEKK